MRGLITLLLVVGLGYFGYTKFFGAPHGGPGMMGGAPPVTVAEVKVQDVQLWQTFSGRLVAVDSAEVRPQVSGIIEKVHFSEGEWVKKGQPLFTIDQRPYLAALQAAEARAVMTQADFARAKTLIAEKAIPQRDFDTKKSDAANAQSELTHARLDYEYSTVKAPVAGRVGRAEITAGNLVSAQNPPLLTTVVADKPIYADFDIDEQTYLNYVQATATLPGKVQSIPVFLGLANETGEPHEGRMQAFDNQLSVSSGTIRARTIYANENGALVPGLYARVRLGGIERKNAILITDRAVGTDQNKKFVIVVKADNSTERREVKLDGMADNLRVVTDGLQPGEKIVVNGLQRIMMPGQPVTPEAGSMDEPAAATPAAGAPVEGKGQMPEGSENETK